MFTRWLKSVLSTSREDLSPARTVMKDRLQLAWNGVELLLKKAEDSLAGTPFQVPVGIVNTLIEFYNAVSDNNDELKTQIVRTQECLSAMEHELAKTNDTDSKDLMKGFAEKLATKLSELDHISKKATWKKILQNEQDKSQLNSIFHYIDEQIKDFQIRLALKIDQNILNLHKLFDQLQLNTWPHSDKAIYNYNLEGVPTLSRGACLPGTRVSILEHICEWAQDSAFTSPPVFWLTGHAGSGKSTIAYSVAEQFHNGKEVLKTLQATFFCSRQFEETKYQKHIIPTLVYQLARHSYIYAESLLAADAFDSVNKSLSNQMDDLLVVPWQKCVKSCSPDLPPYLIVIDALDEIEGKAGAEFLRKLLITIQSGHLQRLKFLVTSRPDPELAKLCASFPPDSVCHLQDVSQEQADRDIMTYLHHALPVFQNKLELKEFGRKANGLFIYASTAVRYISSGTPGEQQDLLRQLLDSTNDRKMSEVPDSFDPRTLIDNLYHQILSEAFDKVQKNHVEARLKLLHTILCTEECISTSVAAGLCNAINVQDMEERADDLMKKLHAVLYVKNDKVFWYHASFPDFIFAQGQSSKICLTDFNNSSSYIKDMSCDAASYHALLAQSCFDIMQRELQFNICNLPSSFFEDTQVPNIQTCIKEKISGVLQYACQHWAQHVMKAIPKEHKNILYKIEKFLEIHVLFWMEAMNLLQLSKQCHIMLQQVIECIIKAREF
ncbi:hypothetical protein H2248_008090 [Termitomyces sp. 'cryptogamus']|nr:hypothetical protein H2248_008090 [Termitomyces sp. 'cryptogamus']